jgi:hypothetical protein
MIELVRADGKRYSITVDETLTELEGRPSEEAPENAYDQADRLIEKLHPAFADAAERRIVYADSRHHSPVRANLVSLSTNDLSDRGNERPLVLSGGRSIHSTPASNRKPQKRQTRALCLIRW